MVNEIQVWFPFPAKVKERARFRSRRRGGPYTPDKTVQFEKAVRAWWRDNGKHFDNLPVGVDVEIHREGMNITVFELEESVRPVGILGDADNYLKAILDGLQPHKHDPEGGLGAFVNDKQVEHLTVKFVGVPRKKKGTNGATRVQALPEDSATAA